MAGIHNAWRWKLTIAGPFEIVSHVEAVLALHQLHDLDAALAIAFLTT